MVYKDKYNVFRQKRNLFVAVNKAETSFFAVRHPKEAAGRKHLHRKGGCMIFKDCSTMMLFVDSMNKGNKKGSGLSEKEEAFI